MVLDRTYAAVIFDVDSTLVDSIPSLFKAWGTWAQEYGLTAAELEGWQGHTSRAIVEALVPDRVEEAHARVEELEAVEVADCVALPGAADALAALPEGLKAVATSGTKPVATARLGAAGLPIPTVFATADQVEHGKPAPDLFLLAAEGLGVDPADCLVCEDAPAGIAAAQAAGCATLAVLTTTAREKLDADLVVDTLADVRFVVDDGRVRVEPVA